MKIESIEAIPLRISFRETFRFGTVDRTRSQNVVVRIRTDDGLVGYGEACPVPAFSGETQASVVELIEQRVRDLIVGQDPLNRRPLVRALERRLFGCPFTLAAVDVALWDLAGKALALPVWALLGGRFRERVTAHGSVGWGSGESMAEVALAQRALGYEMLKLYAGRDTVAGDLERIEAVRTAVGPDVPLLLDVNGLWSVSDCIAALPGLADLGVVLLKQPLAAGDERGQAEVARRSSIDIAADESLFSAADAARIARQQTARVVNLGLSKLGGLLRAGECAAVARAGGLGLMVGSVLELGIATAAGLHLAAALEDLAYPSYLVGPLKYEQQITSPPLQVTGCAIDVPDGPGLGVEVDTELVAALDARR